MADGGLPVAAIPPHCAARSSASSRPAALSTSAFFFSNNCRRTLAGITLKAPLGFAW